VEEKPKNQTTRSLHSAHENNLNSLVAVIHKNKRNAAGNSEKVVHL